MERFSDHQVKIRGFRIELGEIEARLMENAGVRDAVVVAREDTADDKRLVAYYTTASGEGGAMEAAQLRAHLSAVLPECMVPAAYVYLESLPLTATGKLDRGRLPVPELDAYAVRGYEAPQGETETILAGIWAEVLKLERVGRHDNFFKLGGHSLLTLSILGRLEQMWISSSTADLFAHPTISSLAAHIDAQPQSPLHDNVIVIRRGNEFLPIFLAPTAFGNLYISSLAQHMDQNIPIYALPEGRGHRVPGRTIEGIASRMVRKIREVQPDGPYSIAGYSFGGILAYEIAVQLLGENQVVGFVGLIDSTYRPGKGYIRSDDSEKNADKAELLQLVLRDIDTNKSSSSQAYKVIERAATADFLDLVRTCRELSLLPRRYKYLAPSQIRENLAYERSCISALDQYIASPIPIEVHYFRSTAPANSTPTLGWETAIPRDKIHVIDVPGSHESIMMKPHIEGLGKAISVAFKTSMGSVSGLSVERNEPLVKLQNGRKGAPVLVCIPGAGANVTDFVNLIEHLDHSWRIYGLEPQGVDGLHVPHSTVSAATDYYLEALKQADSLASVSLIGHSFGGWVAFELGRRVISMGYGVNSLMIIDSSAPDRDETVSREYNMTDVSMEVIEGLELRLGCSLKIPQNALDRLDGFGQRRFIHTILVQQGLLPKSSHPQILDGMFRTFGTAIRTSYIPLGIYSRPVDLVLADDPRLGEVENQNRELRTVESWKQWVLNLVHWHVPGNHFTLLKPPHVAALGNVVKTRICNE